MGQEIYKSKENTSYALQNLYKSKSNNSAQNKLYDIPKYNPSALIAFTQYNLLNLFAHSTF